MPNLDREILFSNEALIIGMLQVISGGSVVAALAQADVLIKYAGKVPFFLFITFSSLSLMLALLAAYWKHQYKMWDVKAETSEGEATYHGLKHDGGEKAQHHLREMKTRETKANKYLSAMRRVILLSVLIILLAFGELVSSFWYQEFYKTNSPNQTQDIEKAPEKHGQPMPTINQTKSKPTKKPQQIDKGKIIMPNKKFNMDSGADAPPPVN